MFGDTQAFSSLSVPEGKLQEVKTFYGETLGLKVEEIPEGLVIHCTGTKLMIYPADHEPAAYTVLNFVVNDIDAAVDALIAKGVNMERYDLPGMEADEKGIVRRDGSTGPVGIAWFADPHGNTIAVLQEE